MAAELEKAARDPARFGELVAASMLTALLLALCLCAVSMLADGHKLAEAAPTRWLAAPHSGASVRVARVGRRGAHR